MNFKFACTRCGYCCEHIICDVPFGKAGLYLLPSERKLFPPTSNILPMYGVGIKGRARPRPALIIAYQYAEEPCIYYDKQQQKCLIYEKRPITCRAYPLETFLVGGFLHRECPAICNMLEEGERISLDQLKGMETEIAATKWLSQYLHRIYAKHDLTFGYDIEKHKWVRVELHKVMVNE